MHENEISYIIRKCIYEVYKEYGPGLLESVYKVSLFLSMLEKGLSVQQEVVVPLIVNGSVLTQGFRLDLLIENKVIVEIKSIEAINPVHKKQLLTYLKLTGKKLGLLVNFNTTDINSSILRVVNQL